MNLRSGTWNIYLSHWINFLLMRICWLCITTICVYKFKIIVREARCESVASSSNAFLVKINLKILIYALWTEHWVLITLSITLIKKAADTLRWQSSFWKKKIKKRQIWTGLFSMLELLRDAYNYVNIKNKNLPKNTSQLYDVNQCRKCKE